mgnify:CR=1 FL=1
MLAGNATAVHIPAMSRWLIALVAAPGDQRMHRRARREGQSLDRVARQSREQGLTVAIEPDVDDGAIADPDIRDDTRQHVEREETEERQHRVGGNLAAGCLAEQPHQARGERDQEQREEHRHGEIGELAQQRALEDHAIIRPVENRLEKRRGI